MNLTRASASNCRCPFEYIRHPGILMTVVSWNGLHREGIVSFMIRLENYLYDGDTIFRIISKYAKDLEENALLNQSKIDLAHSNFLKQIYELLEHNEFLTSQSQRLREFYNYMVKEYPYLAFTFKGRIKSLIRAEGKFNRYIVDYTYE